MKFTKKYYPITSKTNKEIKLESLDAYLNRGGQIQVYNEKKKLINIISIKASIQKLNQLNQNQQKEQ